MEMDSQASSNKPGIMSRICGWFKALFGKFKAKIGEAVKATKKLGQDDPRRITHSFKVALTLTLVSLIYYTRPLYNGFGVTGMWALLTVVVVFEFTVGGTLSKGMNRGCATLTAGALGVGTNYLANLIGEKGEPYLLVVFVFILGGTSTFMRFCPHIKRRYDYGMVIFILTYCMVTVSGYRVENELSFAHKRLSTILIGGISCMLISTFVCPVWAGQDLQSLLAQNMEKLANFLQGFGNEYFGISGDGREDDVSKKDESVLQGYKSVLSSKQNEESLANFAWWEPGHGCFRFRHPWKQYLKIGGLIRQCAYHIEALHGYLCTDVQESSELRRMIQEPCTKISAESGNALKGLSSSFKGMTRPIVATSHIQLCKAAIEELKCVLQASSSAKSDLLEIIPATTVAPLLIDISKCVEIVSDSIHELCDQVCLETIKPSAPMSENLQRLGRSTIKPLDCGEADDSHVVIMVNNSIVDKVGNQIPHAPGNRV